MKRLDAMMMGIDVGGDTVVEVCINPATECWMQYVNSFELRPSKMMLRCAQEKLLHPSRQVSRKKAVAQEKRQLSREC